MKIMPEKLNQKGQLILALILVMMVALGIGLSVVQRSLVDVSTSSKVEQSSRAFSAAEAGIERALQVGSTSLNFSENSSQAEVSDSGLLPSVPPANNRQEPLEYPPLAKEDIAQVWLADYNSSSSPPSLGYTQNSLEVYWGNSLTDRAALEISLVYFNGTQYVYRKWYLDQMARTPTNNFDISAVCGDQRWEVGSSKYQCKKTLDSLPVGLMLIRARLLYNTTSQPFAVWAVGACGSACNIPPQARILTSTGTSGETQRRVRLFQLNKVVPPYFDYAIFSAGEIAK